MTIGSAETSSFQVSVETPAAGRAGRSLGADRVGVMLAFGESQKWIASSIGLTLVVNCAAASKGSFASTGVDWQQRQATLRSRDAALRRGRFRSQSLVPSMSSTFRGDMHE